MRTTKIVKLSAVLFIGLGMTAFAQDNSSAQHNVSIEIPEVAILDIEGPTSIVLKATAPTEAGVALDFTNAKNETLWLNYSSIVGSSSDPSRTVSVALTSGDIPAGLEIKISAASDAGQGEGVFGTASSELTLSASPQNIITGVGSAFTGTGESKGHKLSYSLNYIDGDYGSLDFDDAPTLIVTYTFSDI